MIAHIKVCLLVLGSTTAPVAPEAFAFWVLQAPVLTKKGNCVEYKRVCDLFYCTDCGLCSFDLESSNQSCEIDPCIVVE